VSTTGRSEIQAGSTAGRSGLQVGSTADILSEIQAGSTACRSEIRDASTDSGLKEYKNTGKNSVEIPGIQPRRIAGNASQEIIWLIRILVRILTDQKYSSGVWLMDREYG
jgi:hypothetical protein